MTYLTKFGGLTPQRVAVAVLGVLAFLFLIWPLWRAQFPLSIWDNEGWNAYHIDEAIGGRQLYRPGDSLVANNYPPLSYYLIGWLSRIFGDALYVGRALSLIATLATGVFVAQIVCQFAAGRLAAAVGGLWYVATMARFFDYYVGINEPQILAQGIMAGGMAWFLKRQAADRAVEPTVLIMVVAGFVKHNIVVMPVVALCWLGLHNWRLGLRAAVFAAAAVLVGLAICYGLYGADFFADMLMPRAYLLERSLKAIGRLQFVLPALIIWLIWARSEIKTPGVRFTALFIGFALLVYLVQKAGAGVDENAQFDLVIAIGVGIGIAFDRLPVGPLTARSSSSRIRWIIFAVLVVRFMASSRLEFAYVIFSADYRELAMRYSEITRQETARIAAMPGGVGCNNNRLVCRMAGKPFAFDSFKVEMMVATGYRSLPSIYAEMAVRGIQLTDIDPRASSVALHRRYER